MRNPRHRKRLAPVGSHLTPPQEQLASVRSRKSSGFLPNIISSKRRFSSPYPLDSTNQVDFGRGFVSRIGRKSNYVVPSSALTSTQGKARRNSIMSMFQRRNISEGVVRNISHLQLRPTEPNREESGVITRKPSKPLLRRKRTNGLQEREEYDVGQHVDVLDYWQRGNGKWASSWRRGIVQEISPDRSKILVHFLHFTDSYNTWIDIAEERYRLAIAGSMISEDVESESGHSPTTKEGEKKNFNHLLTKPLSRSASISGMSSSSNDIKNRQLRRVASSNSLRSHQSQTSGRTSYTVRRAISDLGKALFL